MPELMTVHGSDDAVRSKEHSMLSVDDILLAHRTMVRTRALDNRGMKLQRQGAIGFYLPSYGEEAAQIASAMALGKDDWIAPSYRQPGIALLRGIRPEQLFDNCFGNAGDNALGRQMPVHYSFRDAHLLSISSPIGTQIVQGAGIAMAMRIRKDGRVCGAYFGDGATSSNDFHTGANFAGVFRAPVVLFCINNQWAISMCVDRQTACTTIAQKGEGYGMPGVRVDGNDVFAVYEASRQAVERARRGEGPTLIEILTFRMGPHSSSDDPSRYRDRELEATWRAKDPIARMEEFLVREGLLTKEAIETIHADAETEMAQAAKASAGKPPPALDSLFDDVWSRPTPQLLRQRAELAAEGGDHAADANAAFPL